MVTREQVLALLRPTEPNYAAASALGPEALPYLRDLIQEGDESVASRAAWLAGMIASPGAADVVALATQSKNPVVRVSAAGTLQHLPPAQVAPLLVWLAADGDDGVRRVAGLSAESTGAKMPGPHDPYGTFEGVSFTVSEAAAILALANTASFDGLDRGARLDRRAAGNVVAGRPFTRLDQVAKIKYIGPATLGRLKRQVG